MRRAVDRPQLWLGASLLAALGAVVFAQLGFAAGDSSSFALLVWVGGLVVCAVALWPSTRELGSMPAFDAPIELRTHRPAGLAIGAGFVAVIASAAGWWAQLRRADEVQRWDLIVVWLVAMGAAVIATWTPPSGPWRERLAEWWRRRRGDVGVFCGLFGIGLLLALPRLGSFPWVFNGDEGGFALLSVRMLDGDESNPFGSGYLTHPTMYNALQALAMEVGGRTTAAARFVPAVLAACCLPLVHLVVKRLSGQRWVGFAAAGLLATTGQQLFWSRSALPNGAGVFFVLLVVLLLDRGLTGGGPATWLLVGVAVGLAQYFYFTNQLLVGVPIATVTVALLADLRHRRSAITSITSIAVSCRRALLLIAGFVVATAPQLAFYRRHPEQFASRSKLVSVFANGWLQNESVATGRSEFGVMRDQFMRAAMLPFRTVPTGSYRPGVPLVGMPMAVLAGIGLVTLTLLIARPRLTALATTYWVTVIGMSFTTGAADTNRWVTALPVAVIGAALALGMLVRRALELAPRGRIAVVAWATAMVVGSGAIGLHQFFRDDNQVALYSDTNTQVADHLAQEVLRTDPAATVWFSGAPRMWYPGFNNLVFRTPEVTSHDVDRPWSRSDPRPPIETTTIFAVLPERVDELEVIAEWFPDGVRRTTLADDGEVLYVSYVVEP